MRKVKNIVMNESENENKRLELVVLLNGNYCVIPINKKELNNVIGNLLESIKEGISDELHYFSYSGYTLISRHIIGFYIREPSPAAQYMKEATKLMKKMGNDMDKEDGWKSSDDIND